MNKFVTYLLSTIAFTGAINVSPLNTAIASTLTFSNPGGAIIDNSSTDFFFNVTGFSTLTSDVSLTLSSLTHEDLFELELFLISPTGQVLTLAQVLEGNNLTQTVLDNTGEINIDLGDAPYTGIFAPSGELGLAFESNISSFGGFEDLNPNGIWTLRIYDLFAGNIGSLSNATLSITAPDNPDPAVVPESQPVSLIGAGIIIGVGVVLKRSQII